MAKIFKSSSKRRKSAASGRGARPSAEQCELDILRFADDGRGIATVDNKVVFVEGALPGERVSAEFTRRDKRFDEARCVTVLNAAANRVAAQCPVYERCGGCQLQHLSYEGQLAYKQQRLQALLDGIPGDVRVEVRSAQPFQYRHRARLSYRLGYLGFRRRSSHNVESFDHCPVLMPELDAAIADARATLLAALNPGKSAELHFALGYSENNEIAIALRIEDQSSRRIAWCEELAATLAPQLVLQSVSSPGGEWRNRDAASLYYSKSDFGSRHSDFYAGDFTQVNPAVNRQIIDQSMAWLAPVEGDTIADYFCGLGNFSFPLAQRGARVVGFDAGAEMITRAQQALNAYGEELAVEFHIADLFSSGQLAFPQGVTKVLLDPPRAGAKALCERLAGQASLEEIVYVSCDSATLARDLTVLAEGGFTLRGAVSADMFPQTHHMESVVYLTRD